MQSVGTQIRAARLRTSLSLEQVSANTCITVRILQAIEEDDLSQIISAFFYKSFVRQFCGQVGLPFDSLQEPIAAAVSGFPDPLMPGQGEAVIRSSIVRPQRKPRNLRWLYPAVSLATVLMACSGFYTYWEGVRSHLSGSGPQSRAAMTKQPGTQSPSVDAGETGMAQSKAAVPAEPDGRFHVELSAVERTWLSIRADGRQVYAGTLEVDQTKVLEGREQGQLRTGNAGGVNIVFNGKPIGLAGPHGSVRTVVFTKDNYEVLPAPVRAAITILPTTIGGWLLAFPPAL